MFVATKRILAGGWLSHNLASINVVIYDMEAGFPTAKASSSLEETFERAVQLASSPEGGQWPLTLTQRGTLYACYKQATVGDCNTKRPGMSNFYARQKHYAWTCAKGGTKEEAMRRYIETVALFAPEFSSY